MRKKYKYLNYVPRPISLKSNNYDLVDDDEFCRADDRIPLLIVTQFGIFPSKGCYKGKRDYSQLKGLEYQKNLERMAFTAGGRTQAAPAQRLTDFVEGRLSIDLNPTSYQPGLNSAPLHTLLPSLIGNRLRTGFKAFGQKMHGFYTNEANVIGVESRTSSPVKIPRTEQLQHPEIEGLYPCGEGGGYAGGIISAAMDGERCAEAATKNL